jgi:hypothetical protein
MADLDVERITEDVVKTLRLNTRVAVVEAEGSGRDLRAID